MFDLSLLNAFSVTLAILLLLRLKTRSLGMSSKGEPWIAHILLLSIWKKKKKWFLEDKVSVVSRSDYPAYANEMQRAFHFQRESAEIQSCGFGRILFVRVV